VSIIADTNAVLAFLLEDRPTERCMVADWVADHGPLLVTEAVFIETCWVLGGGKTGSRDGLVGRISRLLGSSSFVTWDHRLVGMTLELSRVIRASRSSTVSLLLEHVGAISS
jgi:predicted nucleic-acid-binding protein